MTQLSSTRKLEDRLCSTSSRQADWICAARSDMADDMAIATPSRLDHVQALRGLAAMLVLFAHLALIEGRTATNPILPSSLDWGMMGVDLFFVISGFIMVYVTRDWQAGGGQNRMLGRVPEFLFARATRIYPLYWVVTAALFAVWLVRPDLVFSSSPNNPTVINTLFLIPGWAYPLLEVGWTLVYEMMFYVLFALLLFLPRRFRPLGLLIWAAIALAGNLFSWQSQIPALSVTSTAIAFHLFNPLVFEFLAGAAVGWLYLTRTGDKTVSLALILFGLIGMGMWIFSAVPFEDGWPRVLRLTLPAGALVLGAAWLDHSKVKAPRFAVTLGDWSYSLYLTHLLSLVALSKLWQMAGLQDLPSPLLILIMLSGALIVAGLTHRFIEKPLINLARSGRKRLFT